MILFGLLPLALSCERETEYVPVWGNGTADGLINGKRINDPELILRPPGYPLFMLGSYATQYIGADSNTYYTGTHRYRKRQLHLTMYESHGGHLGDFVVELKNFNPGSKTLNPYQQGDRFDNYSS